jgi:hypothetical protein
LISISIVILGSDSGSFLSLNLIVVAIKTKVDFRSGDDTRILIAIDTNIDPAALYYDLIAVAIDREDKVRVGDGD